MAAVKELLDGSLTISITIIIFAMVTLLRDLDLAAADDCLRGEAFDANVFTIERHVGELALHAEVITAHVHEANSLLPVGEPFSERVNWGLVGDIQGVFVVDIKRDSLDAIRDTEDFSLHNSDWLIFVINGSFLSQDETSCDTSCAFQLAFT